MVRTIVSLIDEDLAPSPVGGGARNLCVYYP